MRINKELLRGILEGRLDKQFDLFIKHSEYKPVFLRIGNKELFSTSTRSGTVKATPQELEVLAQVIDINRIQIGIDNE